MENLALFIVLAFAAEILGTIGGFGSSLFFVPIASYFLDFHEVLGITALFHVSSNLIKIFFFRKGFNRKLVISIGIPAVLFVILGAYCTNFIEVTYLEISLALFLMIISMVLLIFRKLTLKPSLSNSIGGGIVSGFIAGLLGTGGAIRGLVLAAYDMKMEIFIATSAIIDLGIDSGRSVVYIFNGYVHSDILYLLPILFVVSIAGTYTGKRILKHISEKQFKSIVLLLIFITGIVTLIKILRG